MKYLIFSFLFVLGLSSCQDSINDYSDLPDCLKEIVDDSESDIVRIGIANEDFGYDEDLFWIFYDGRYFGEQVNGDCETSHCYGWCGLTTAEEIDLIFERSWTLLWEK